MKKWIFPCNPKYYNVEDAFSELEELDWKQRVTQIEVGDLVFIYVSNGVNEIKYLCEVVKTNKDKITIDDSKYYICPEKYVEYKRHVQLRLIKKYNEKELTFKILREHGLKSNLMGAMNVNGELESLLDKYI